MNRPSTPILRVAVPTPVAGLFDYLPPTDCRDRSFAPGQRLRVPFGHRTLTGILVEVRPSSEQPTARLKSALELLDDSSLLPEGILALAQWASAYYHHPIGEVLANCLPPLLRRGASAVAKADLRVRVTNAGAELDPATLARAPRQRELLTLLQEQPCGLSRAELRAHAGDCSATLRTLRTKGLVEEIAVADECAPAFTAERPTHTLTDAQREAVDAVSAAAGTYTGFLLNGVTGSGKTEVYLTLIERIVATGHQALVLVPEIGLTPQLIDRFRRRLHTRLAILHSGLTENERLSAWLAARDGRAGVVIGTRSAAFVPLAKPGLFIVDEEHDASLKQQDGLRYSARDLLAWRAHRDKAPLLLGSATPSLESLFNAECGKYRQLLLPQRAGKARPPRIGVLDVRGQPMREQLSQPLIEEMRKHLGSGAQVLLFLNRRGYAPTLLCHDCGWVAQCPHCDAHMTLHSAAHRLRCHHCGAERRINEQCPDCGSTDLRALGAGTERVEQVLTETFPEYRLARIDRDSTRRKGSMEQLLALARSGEAQILLGTQMLAKGHHFPGVTLVGLLDVDRGLFSSDFRAAERMAQLIVQVAGRAGRAERPGEVLLQTHHPDHPLLQTLLRQGYDAFAKAALAERRAAGFPPYASIALLRAEAATREAPQAFLREAVRLAAEQGSEAVQLWGPVSAPMERRAGRFRAQLLLQSPSRAPLHKLLDAVLPTLAALPQGRRVRWSLDVDPQDML